ncbi:MAG: hypothetical protein OCD01_05610 [Fibrobacterales bacterium]
MQYLLFVLIFFTSSIYPKPPSNDSIISTINKRQIYHLKLNKKVIQRLDSLSAQNKSIRDVDSIVKTRDAALTSLQGNVSTLNIKLDSQIAKSLLIENALIRAETDDIKDLLIPIVLSIIAAFIFKFIFNDLPYISRRRKIRPKINHQYIEIYELCEKVFDEIMRPNRFSNSYYGHVIRNNNMSVTDFKDGLQNKILNDSHNFEDAIKLHMDSIGKSVWNRLNEIISKIINIYEFEKYLPTNEITILESIKIAIHSSEFKKYKKRVKQVRCFPNCLRSEADNIYSLYREYINIKKVIFDDSVYYEKVHYIKIEDLYDHKKFKQTWKYAYNILKKHPENKHNLQPIIIASYIHSGMHEKAMDIMRDVIINDNFPTWQYSWVALEFEDQEEIKKLLTTHISKNFYTNLLRGQEGAKNNKMAQKEQIKSLKEYYNNPDSRGEELKLLRN